MAQKKLLKREEVKKEDCWAIEDLYENDELWREDTEKLRSQIKAIGEFKGKLTEKKETLLQFLNAVSYTHLVWEIKMQFRQEFLRSKR